MHLYEERSTDKFCWWTGKHEPPALASPDHLVKREMSRTVCDLMGWNAVPVIRRSEGHQFKSLVNQSDFPGRRLSRPLTPRAPGAA